VTALALFITPRALGHIQAAPGVVARAPSVLVADRRSDRRGRAVAAGEPESGAPVLWKTRTRDLRRVILFRIGYHLYYRVNAKRARLEIVGFWHERRRPPRF